MRPFTIRLLISVSSCPGLITWADPAESVINSSLRVVIADGGITDLAEPQTVRLSRSNADPVTGRFGQIPLTGVSGGIMVDSVPIISLTETNVGHYQGQKAGGIKQTTHSV